MQKITRYQNFLLEEVTGNPKIDQDLNANDQGMVYGIVDILKRVKDKENRLEIAKHMISTFKNEKISFPYDEFFKMCGLDPKYIDDNETR